MLQKKIFHLATCLCIGIAVAWVFPAATSAEDMPAEPVKLETGLYYTVQKGDTLWDLSEHFYDSAWIWPDLWEKNEEIANPHWIYPGEQIRIFTREELEALLGAEEPEEPEIFVPPPEPAFHLYHRVNTVDFVRKKPIQPSGEIFAVKEDKGMISQRDLVYVRPMRGVCLEPGDRFTVYHTLKKRLKDPDSRKVIGIQHHILGVVEIVELHPEFALATVLDSFWSIQIGDLLMPYEERSPRIVLRQGVPGLRGKVFGALRSKSSLYGEHFIVFIDKGFRDGVRVGQSYSVYYQEEERINPRKRKKTLLPPVDYATILILRTEETTATALVTYSEKSIEPGATIHTLQAPIHAEME